jgi:hypothetical protein
VNALTLEQWLAEYQRLKKLNQESKVSGTPVEKEIGNN